VHSPEQERIADVRDRATQGRCRLDRAEAEERYVGRRVTSIIRPTQGLGAIFDQDEIVCAAKGR